MKFMKSRFEFDVHIHLTRLFFFHIVKDDGEKYIFFRERLRKDREDCVLSLCRWHLKLLSPSDCLLVFSSLSHTPVDFTSPPVYTCATHIPSVAAGLSGLSV